MVHVFVSNELLIHHAYSRHSASSQPNRHTDNAILICQVCCVRMRLCMRERLSERVSERERERDRDRESGRERELGISLCLYLRFSRRCLVSFSSSLYTIARSLATKLGNAMKFVMNKLVYKICLFLLFSERNVM